MGVADYVNNYASGVSQSWRDLLGSANSTSDMLVGEGQAALSVGSGSLKVLNTALNNLLPGDKTALQAEIDKDPVLNYQPPSAAGKGWRDLLGAVTAPIGDAASALKSGVALATTPFIAGVAGDLATVAGARVGGEGEVPAATGWRNRVQELQAGIDQRMGALTSDQKVTLQNNAREISSTPGRFSSVQPNPDIPLTVKSNADMVEYMLDEDGMSTMMPAPGGGTIHTIRSPNGKTILQERPGELPQVTHSLTAEEAQGSGEGLARLEKAYEVSVSRGHEGFNSDNTLSPAGAKVYSSLEDKGYTVERRPYSLVPGVGNYMRADDRGPLFKVTGPTVASMANAAKAAKAVSLDQVKQMAQAWNMPTDEALHRLVSSGYIVR